MILVGLFSRAAEHIAHSGPIRAKATTCTHYDRLIWSLHSLALHILSVLCSDPAEQHKPVGKVVPNCKLHTAHSPLHTAMLHTPNCKVHSPNCTLQTADCSLQAAVISAFCLDWADRMEYPPIYPPYSKKRPCLLGPWLSAK